MIRVMKSNKRVVLYAEVLLAVLYLISIYGKIHLQYDDWGYFCLSYPRPMPENSSRNYQFEDLIQYATNWHYQYAQGRLSFLIIALGINMIGGLWALRFVLTAAIVFIFWWIKKNENAENWREVLSFFIPCMLYGLMGQYLHGAGTYWYVAAWYYVLPIPFVLILWDIIRKERTGIWRWVIAVLAFILGNAQEQIFVLTFSFLALSFLHRKVILKESAKNEMIGMAASLLGAVIILSSPGAWRRMGLADSMGIVDRVLQSGANVVDNLFSTQNFAYMLAFLIGQCILSTFFMRRQKLEGCHVGQKAEKVFGYVHFVVSFALILAFLNTYIENRYEYISITRHDWKRQVFLCVYFFNCVLGIFERYKIKYGDLTRGILTIAAALSVVCLCVFPELSGRCYLPFVLLSFGDLTDLFLEPFEDQNRVISGAFACILVCLLALSGQNLIKAYQKYSEADVVLIRNEEILQQAAVEKQSEVHLYRVPDRQYSIFMDNDFEKSLIRYYFGLDENVVMVYDL